MEYIQEKQKQTVNGYLMLAILIICVATAIFGFFTNTFPIPISILLVLTAAFVLSGLFIVNPNESKVLTLFGKYVGTVKKRWLSLGKSIFYA